MDIQKIRIKYKAILADSIISDKYRIEIIFQLLYAINGIKLLISDDYMLDYILMDITDYASYRSSSNYENTLNAKNRYTKDWKIDAIYTTTCEKKFVCKIVNAFNKIPIEIERELLYKCIIEKISMSYLHAELGKSKVVILKILDNAFEIFLINLKAEESV